MFGNAMSSAKEAINRLALCLHISKAVYGFFHRATARERDGAKRNRAALRTTATKPHPKRRCS